MKKMMIGLLALCFVGGIIAPAFSIDQKQQAELIKKQQEGKSIQTQQLIENRNKYGMPSPVIINDKFKDPNLLLAVKNAIASLKKVPIQKIVNVTALDASKITSLIPMSGYIITDLSGIEYLTNLQCLLLGGKASIDSLEKLAGLTKIKEIYVSNCNLKSLSGLENMTSLEFLSAQQNSELSDISSLAGAINLKQLQLHQTAVQNISALSGLKNLSKLMLDSTAVNDILPLINNSGLGQGDAVFLPTIQQKTTTGIPYSQVKELMAKLVNVSPADAQFYINP